MKNIQDISDFTLHSGGAKGADLEWDKIGREYGLTNIKHYYVKGFKTPNGNVCIESEKAKSADSLLKEVNKIIKRKFPTRNEYVNNLLRRNVWQVEFSDAVYAIAQIENNLVQGGTGWAAHLAIIRNKPVYVFDENKDSWFFWDTNEFKPYNRIPKLTKNFAGIGSRNITSKGINAINKIYKNTK